MSRSTRRKLERRRRHAEAARAGRVAAVAGLSLGTAFGAGAPAQAAPDVTVTNLNDSGPGSLRQAVVDSNADFSPNRIVFKSTLSGTITLGSGQMNVQSPVDIVGPGAKKLTVSGKDNDQIFYIYLPGCCPAVTISGLTLTHGVGFDGGALFNANSTLTISKSVITGNNAAFGAGVGNGFYTGFSPPLTIRDSTISQNKSTPYCCGGVYSKGDLTIERSTIAGNTTATNGGGVGVFSGADSALHETTISGNSAAISGGGFYIFSGAGSRSVINTIIADNSGPTNPDVSLGVGSLPAAFSLIESPGGTPITGAHTITGVDPKLGPLKDNGGPTPTEALKPGSPAIDAGTATAPDQRGAPRPFNDKGAPAVPSGNNSDIGAYERVLCGGVLVNRVGTAGRDTLIGTPGPDGILGLGGKDLLIGKGGRDGLCGGPGRDRLKGGPGKDKLLGGPGKDKQKQ